MKKLFLFLLLGAGLLTYGQQAEPLHLYFVRKVADSVVPENMTSEKMWQGVPPSVPFVFNAPKKDSVLTLDTTFQAVYNNKYLFVRVEAEESQVNKLDFSPTRINRDMMAVFRTAHVEFFLDPDLLGKSAGQVVANIQGAIYDAIVCGGTKDWRYDVVVRSKKGDKKWYLMVAFPFIDKGVAVTNVFGMFPHSSPLIAFNACRSAALNGQRATQWSKTPDNSYDRPKKYGILVMTGEKDVMNTLQKFLSGREYSSLLLEGAVKNATSIYLVAIKKAISSGFTNGRMLAEPRKSQVMKELRSMQKRLQKKLPDAELAKILTRCGAINGEIATAQTRMGSSILDEF